MLKNLLINNPGLNEEKFNDRIILEDEWKAINKLASLPSLEVLRGKIVGLLISTQTNLVCALNASQSGLPR